MPINGIGFIHERREFARPCDAAEFSRVDPSHPMLRYVLYAIPSWRLYLVRPFVLYHLLLC